MATAHSKLNDASQAVDRLTHHMASDPPPIKFMRSERASKSPADTMYHEFEYRLDNANKKSTKMSKKTLMFENGDAKMWCDWRIELEDLIRLAPLTTAEHKSNAALTLFKGKALQNFKEYTRTVDNLNDEREKKRQDSLGRRSEVLQSPRSRRKGILPSQARLSQAELLSSLPSIHWWQVWCSRVYGSSSQD
jgi:hypothetical protein